jgi:hypothetical protein
MRAAAACLLLLPLASAFAGDADAAGVRKSRRPQASPAPAVRAPSRDPMAQNGYSGYYERIEDRVPFGSRIWWDVYTSMPRGG